MEFKKIISTNIKAFKLVSSWRKWFFPSMVAYSLLSYLAPFLTLYMSAEIVSELAGAREPRRLTALVLFTVTADLVIVLLGALLNKINNLERQHLENAEKRTFIEFGLNMDYEHMENPDISRRRRKIDESRNISNYGIWRFVSSINDIVNNFFRIILALAFMIELFIIVARHSGEMVGVIAFPVFIVTVTVILVLVSLRNSKILTKLSNELSNSMTELNQIYRAFPSSYQVGKEVRLYNLSGIFINWENRFMDSLKKGFKSYYNGWRKTQYPDVILRQGLNFSVYVFVCLNAVRGLIDIGGVIKYIGFISRLVTAVTNLCYDLIGLRTNLPFLIHYLEFFEIRNKMYNGTMPVEKRKDNKYEIEFKNVSFKYPGSDTYALKNFSMKLNIGQRLAIVGMNGSGKTTMIKLLCRLYDATEGEITLNGLNIKKYNYKEYMGIFSVVFQDFKLFGFSLAQNIAASMESDVEKAGRCLQTVGFGERLNDMPKGLDTCLYKDFEEDGVEISVGEAQKISLARALYKNAPFIVLDEPTSALDPISEYEIYSKFNEIVGDKTAVYISHRLSSCRFCDDIAVFHEGECIQRGSHDELILNEKGKYYELWNAQAQYYTEKKAE